MAIKVCTLSAGIALGAMLLLTGCGGGDSPASSSQSGSAVSATPVGGTTVTTEEFNVQRCLQQQIAPGVTVANLVVPDTLTIHLDQPSGFPNGRRLTDPVIDLTLAAILLDLTKQPVTTLVDLQLNPESNDLPFRTAFPYLAAAQGNPPTTTGSGRNYNFRTDPASAYVRVDRMGMPAVATALIRSAQKTAYNDASPSDDVNFKFLAEITADLTEFTDQIGDQLTAKGLSLCATKN
jgi:hypothetical protein